MKLPVSELSVPSAAGNLGGRNKERMGRGNYPKCSGKHNSQEEAVFETLCL